eukprot:6172129-Pleurochrysis_carterae.AAC.1
MQAHIHLAPWRNGKDFRLPISQASSIAIERLVKRRFQSALTAQCSRNSMAVFSRLIDNLLYLCAVCRWLDAADIDSS